MNETLSDEDIGYFSETCQVKENGFVFSRRDMQKALNTIEAKDAKIKQLVEALEKDLLEASEKVKEVYARERIFVEALDFYSHPENWPLNSLFKDCDFRIPKGFCNKAKQALSTIPDVEGYSLEREFVDSYLNYWVCGDGWNKVLLNIKALEAHRDKVKNDA